MNTQLIATAFRNTDSNAHPEATFTAPLHGFENHRAFFDMLQEFLGHAADDGVEKFALSLSGYRGAHNSKGWTEASAVLLEYEASDLSRVQGNLDGRGMGWTYVILPTRGDRFAVVIPVSEPIIMSSHYSRVASLLLADVGVSGATEGCQTNTFLVKPRNRAQIEVHLTENVLDAENYRVSADAERRWVEAKDYTGMKSAILKSMPPLGAAKAHLIPPRPTWDGNDLFTF